MDTTELRERFVAVAKQATAQHRSITCTREELTERIIEFFDSKQVVDVDENGEVIGIRQVAPITMTGLANWLGIDRATLIRYARGSDEYGDIISAARAKIEELYEGRLVYGGGNPAGVIFALKNIGWSDETKIVVSDSNERRLTPAEIQEIADSDIVT